MRPTRELLAGLAVVRDRRLIAPATSLSIGAIAVTVFFAIGAWQRRWIADDGLIVLRTIRNLYAGNGPVFNAGERVEANTSTAWTYLLAFWGWITDAQLEYVALWVALVLSLAAIPVAMYGTARLYGRQVTAGGVGLLLPLGAIVYIAIPPARDFATSGLENGLVIFWIAVLWCLLLAWSRRDTADSSRRSRLAFLLLAFVAGLAPLIRPEITVLGGLVLLLLFCSPIGWRMRVGMVVLAAVVPVGYQIFRMGYYAVLVPNPAIAKDASGSKWGQGLTYLGNLVGPYRLVVPLVLAIVAAIVIVAAAMARRSGRTNDLPVPEEAETSDAPSILDMDTPSTLDTYTPSILDTDTQSILDTDTPLRQPSPLMRVAVRWQRFSRSLQRPGSVVTVVLLAGIVLTLYWLRQGGDFMHGRVLLAPIFILLLPVMVIPVVLPERVRTARGAWELAGSALLIGLWGGVVWWAVANHANTFSDDPLKIGRDGIVDERRFYVANIGNENPVTAADYLDFPRMRSMVEGIEKYRQSGGVLLPGPDYDHWYIAEMPQKLPPGKERVLSVYFLNLGMTSMNAPLDVRVVDQMGLAYPIAAHTERLTDGRIGHDKNLPSEWVVAETGASYRYPSYLSRDEIREATVALTCPATQDRIASYKASWNFGRFRHNLRQSFTFNSYRISRVPEYEILRCGLTPPVTSGRK